MPNLNMMTGGAGVGSARELAEMLRQMGRGRDKVLAHITPEEADMLIQAGGSGSINPNTGLPEFQPMDEDYEFEAYGPTADRTPSPVMNENYGFGYGDAPTPDMSRFQQQMPSLQEFVDRPGLTPNYSQLYETYRAPQGEMGTVDIGQPAAMPQIARPRAVDPFAYIPAADTTGELYRTETPGLLSRLERAGERFQEFANKQPTTTRIAGAGTNLLLSGLLARRAGREREAFAQELRQNAQPYAQAQQEALQRAQGGGMTAAQQRAFDIAQARARQGLSRQNLGTGSAAAGIQSGQAARARSLARQESFDEALNLAKIRDSYLREAARQELQADTDLANALVGVLQNEIREATTTQATAPQQTTRR